MTQVTPPPGRSGRSVPRPTRRDVLDQHLPEAERRLVRTVDGLADADWDAPSGLPGWTRAQVVAHLALNAEGLAGALRGVAAGDNIPMYRTPEARDDDITELAAAGPVELRSRLLAAGPGFAEAAAAVPDDRGDTPLERTPGDSRFRVGDVAWMRWREVEIHHADLGAGYGPQDWSPAFSLQLLDAMTGRGAADAAFSAYASDLDETWTIGGGAGDLPAGAVVVTGTAAALAWWLTGRGTGEGLTSERGELPQIGAW